MGDIEIKDSQKVCIKPGDIIVLRVENEVTPWHKEELGTMLIEAFPSNQCLVLSDGAELQVYSVEGVPL